LRWLGLLCESRRESAREVYVKKLAMTKFLRDNNFKVENSDMDHEYISDDDKCAVGNSATNCDIVMVYNRHHYHDAVSSIQLSCIFINFAH
jgi:hypothetical protein